MCVRGVRCAGRGARGGIIYCDLRGISELSRFRAFALSLRKSKKQKAAKSNEQKAKEKEKEKRKEENTDAVHYVPYRILEEEKEKI